MATPGSRGDSCEPAPVSKAELEKRLKQYKSVSSLEARFEQVKRLKDADLTLKSSGELRLRGGEKKAEVDWIVRKPAYLHLHITDSSLELSEEPGKAGKPLVESKELRAKILRPIYAWLTMNSELITQQFDVSLCGDYSLSPKDKESPISMILMALDRQGFVREVRLREKSGDGITISFKDTKVTRTK